MALNGTVVLDLCRGFPGARCGAFLADFGADVIRVDPPTGAVSTLTLAGVEDREGEKLSAFSSTNRNKKSIKVNLRSEQGQQILYKLVKKADILLEGFRPGVMQKNKCDYETLKKLNPRLIYCALTGFGQDGPYAKLPGHDLNYVALSGALSLIGPRNGPPCMPSNVLADVAAAGFGGTIGILLALQARERTGKGQFVDISYLDGVVSLLDEAGIYFSSGQVPKRGETFVTGGMVCANVYRCKDGEYVTIGCYEPNFWQNFCRAIGREDLIPLQDPPPEKKNMVESALNEIFLTKTRDEWYDFLRPKEVPVGPVYYVNEAFQDPQVLHRKMVVEMDHPRLGKIKQLGIPIKLSDTPGSIRSLGVPPGTNTNEIMQSLGYSKEEAEELRKAKAIE
jgi:crotonobetainyl-CoA:carnitine CoA-transferase CaiB-like acyl-CoA transferase